MRSVPGNSSDTSLKRPPLTARGSPIRSKSVLVSHPSPLKPLPPCSAGTEGSAPASAFGKTGYAFLSVETFEGVLLAGVEPDGWGAGLVPPPQATRLAQNTTRAARAITRIDVTFRRRTAVRVPDTKRMLNQAPVKRTPRPERAGSHRPLE